MGCTNLKKKDDDILKIAPEDFVHEEALILSKIYDDLSDRSVSHTINKQVFLLFFHKTGYWGDRLFRQFAGKSNTLSKQLFLKGIAHIFQTSEEDKIQLLYNFYVETKQNRGQGKRGLTFKQFLSIVTNILTQLYSYPKQELTKIMDDEDFLKHDVKDFLKQLNLNDEKSQIDKKKFAPKIKTSSQLNSKNKLEDAEYQMTDSEPSIDRIPSMFGFKKETQHVQALRKPHSIDMHIDGKRVRIKISSYNTLIRKFARSIFRAYSLDYENGRLKKEQFTEWIKNHKNLYNNYYDGFHGQIWEYTRDQPPRPLYLQVTPDKESKVLIVLDSADIPCLLKLINSTILVLNQNNPEELYSVINLQGLCVNKEFDTKRGWSININHRDRHYKAKKIVFKDQSLCNEWMKELRFYKGFDIRQLYEFGHKIGMGKFSVVSEVTEIKTGQKWAMKQIKNDDSVAQSHIEMIQHEVEVMKKFDNPLLVQYKETIQTKESTYIIIELVSGGKELSEYVRCNKGPLSEIQAAAIARQIIMGVLHIHKVGYIHRDLKPQNIMVVTDQTTNQVSIKIIDFGLSLNTQTALRGEDDSGCAGTPGYIAPEQFYTNQMNETIDSFSIGGIIYFMLTGSTPFFNSDSDTMEIIKNRNRNRDLKFDDHIWSNYSSSAKQIVQQLMQMLPSNRLSLSSALVHSWFKQTNPRNIRSS